jgi:hypothetical protein
LTNVIIRSRNNAVTPADGDGDGELDDDAVGDGLEETDTLGVTDGEGEMPTDPLGLVDGEGDFDELTETDGETDNDGDIPPTPISINACLQDNESTSFRVSRFDPNL